MADKFSGYLYIQCSPSLLGSKAEELANAIYSQKDAYLRGVVLGLQEVQEIDVSFFRLIAYVGKMLRTERKKFYGLAPSSALGRDIRQNGLDSSIQLVATENLVEGETQAKPPKINVDFINPFVEAAQKTLATQCNLQVRTGKPFLKGSQPCAPIDIAGVIGLTAKEFSGSIALCFPKDTFLGAMEGMLGERYPEITDDLKDGAGELLNIIFGQSKIMLSERGYTIEKAIPTVVSGKALELQHMVAAPAIVLPFECERGGFYIEVGCS